MAEPEQHERRLHKRSPLTKGVEVVGTGLSRCSDLHLDGMFLETAHYYPVGTVLDLKFNLRETYEHPINVQARVAYTHEGYGIGLCFSTLKLEVRQKIEKFIDEA